MDSRLTPLVQRFSSSGIEQIAGSRMTYHCSYEAPLGELTFNDSGASSSPAQESRVAVSGDLVIDVQKGFELSQQSRLCLLYTSPSPRDQRGSRMPSSA